MNKIAVYHFHNGKEGGVFSVIKNLLLFSTNPDIENHVIYTINKDVLSEYACPNLKGAATESIFYYSPRANFLSTCQALADLIPNKHAVLVTHDWLELGMISNMGLQNPVITFLHGDYEYYYELATLHQNAIDKFVVVAANMQTRFKNLLSSRSQDIHYLRFPVPEVRNDLHVKTSANIAFVGRLSADKGYPLLPIIDEILTSRNIFLNWHIAGTATGDRNEENIEWNKERSPVLYGHIKNEEVILLLSKMDFFILPSSHEGLPVTLVEAMKCGAIPLVNDIAGGIQELVEDEVTGFKIKGNIPIAYANKIVEIISNRLLKDSMQQNCIEKANRLFNPEVNTRLIEEEIYKTYKSAGRIKTSEKIYGSRLDKKWVPNLITKALRSVK